MNPWNLAIPIFALSLWLKYYTDQESGCGINSLCSLPLMIFEITQDFFQYMKVNYLSMSLSRNVCELGQSKLVPQSLTVV
jgi:hypothetical protein